jgi:hypothetical protein
MTWTPNCTLTLVDYTSRKVVSISVPLSEVKTLMSRGLGTWVEPPPALLEFSDKIDNLPPTPEL